MVHIFSFSQIHLGDNLDNLQIIKKEKILITPNQIEDGYIVEKDSVIYEICVGNDNKIYFVSTKDPNFYFQGLHIGSSLKEIKNITNKNNIKGWGYVIENGSEWKYVFDVIKIKPKSKISSFFKYNPKDKNESRDKKEFKIKIE